MRRHFSIILIFLAFTALPRLLSAADDDGWQEVPKILARIHAPQFPDRDFRVSQFGAVGDGETDCKLAFDRAIAECSAAGGGRVLVPTGNWFIRGPIRLKSRINL